MSKEKKLTLSVDEDVIKGAKELAARKETSVSNIVEDILIEMLKLNKVDYKKNKKEKPKKDLKITGELAKLKGIIKNAPSLDAKEIKMLRLLEKYS